MADSPALALMKTNLGYPAGSTLPQEVEENLQNTLDAAEARLAAMGFTLEVSKPVDLRFLTAFALYLYRHADSDRPMPRPLRDEINDRKVRRATTPREEGQE